MAVAGRAVDIGTDSAAEALHTAGFVRLFVTPDTDSIAAAGLLGRTLAERGTPFQASVVTEHDEPETDDETTVVVGFDDVDAVSFPGDERPASERAFETAHALDADPDPVLALAGAFDTPSDFEDGDAFETARERGRIQRRPGVAIPVADPIDGLCHTALAHAPFSGDSEATATALDEIDFDDDRRRVASVLALSVCKDSTPRAADAIERALGPYTIESTDDRETPTVTFETVGGFADVLRASARERPGIALALALGHDVREPALSAWRTHTERAHRALDEATTERHRGLFVARVDVDASLSTVARLLYDFRSPEPVAVAVSGERAAAATADNADLGERMAEAGAVADGSGGGNERRGWARFPDPDRFVTALREALA